MESRDDIGSILPFLPVILRSSAFFWPPSVVETLKSLSSGPTHSNVNSGQLFALAIADLRNSLGLLSLHSSAPLGFSLFFDDLMNKDEAEKWFQQVVPRLADLLMRLPALLDSHYQNAGVINGMATGLRLLKSQQSGIVFLSQELIAALLVCALFCLFPTNNRGAKHLPLINFDDLFVCLYKYYSVSQENKVKCIIHYFERICSNLPMGNVSFERKVLHLKNSPTSDIVYPEADLWSKSVSSLCQLEVCTTGLIEDQLSEALEVDFANKYIGGGALSRGCVQEEIRFMINPELIASTLFLPSMADNEAIEIVGAERFSSYIGYAKSFRFSGDYVDKKSVDTMGRRRTRIVAIDALCSPGKRQYRLECLLREINKAFCGFLDQHKCQSDQVKQNNEGQVHEIGVATGNWGCGAFGGDPEVKVVIQWLAASQARRPFILYYTFSLEPLQKLELVVQWVLSQEWTVGELWNILVEYSTQKLRGETTAGLFKWLIPSLYDVDDPMIVDASF
ncbi:poly(ADP-ribose) glycohydrolase 1 [Phtheirospermum japonicum]|uniref:poly(ADP-ribose) glycohydrolase n=1 Tax=Phtheirospermum japonicum TaxID=374723 RepID=A0A830CTF6_9LAMI|nr:poly(ADP-ribose) glycohydrolase 1 [Phtheirospermum japonicum]